MLLCITQKKYFLCLKNNIDNKTSCHPQLSISLKIEKINSWIWIRNQGIFIDLSGQSMPSENDRQTHQLDSKLACMIGPER